ncbi:MAG: RluA family pseudouridine synthase [Phycisphaeraceae bacterium]
MPIEHHRHTVTAEQAGRIDHVVQALVAQSRRYITGLFDHGCVTLNGDLCPDSFARVKPDDIVELNHDPHRGYSPIAKAWHSSAFRIIFEDASLIVVDKAAWVLTVPTGPTHDGSLVDAVSEYVGRSGRRDKAHVVHRLDRGVSGLLVFAKTPQVAEQLKAQFAKHRPQRLYVALVAGQLDGKSGTFRSYLATAANLDRYSTRDKDKGELAITHYQAQRQAHGATLVHVRLETGKRNQIRVQFAEAGHPVLGDPRYRVDLAQHPRWNLPRLALHAAELGFDHPTTGAPVRFEAPLPGAFAFFFGQSRKA